MSVADLSTSAQNYLKIIWSVSEWSEDAATITSIASYSGLQKSSVSGAVTKLVSQGLVEHAPYGAVTLTADGRSMALAMVGRHRLLETFLVKVLSYRWDEVHAEAEHLEHAVSDLLIERIDDALGHPTRDPHGDPIPTADGQVVMPCVQRLTRAPRGRTLTVERICDDDPGLLRFFADHGLVVGAHIDVADGAPYSGSTEVTAPDGTQVALGESATDAIWVSEPTD